MVFFNSILYNTSSVLICIVLLGTIYIFYLAGTALGAYRRKKDPAAKMDGVGALDGALMGLLALLLSFTFSMSASRFDERRAAIIHEANTIGTAILRADLYPDSIRNEFRKDFKQYVEARIAYFDAGNDEQKIDQSLAETNIISGRLWKRATTLSVQSGTVMPHSQSVPALNDMIDAVTTREAARIATVPDLIIWLLIILTVLVSMIIGYNKKEQKNDWILLSIYSLMTVITIFTILDLDRPSRGIIKTAIQNHKIIELRNMFK